MPTCSRCLEKKPLDAFSDAQLVSGKRKCLQCSNPRLHERKVAEGLAGRPLVGVLVVGQLVEGAAGTLVRIGAVQLLVARTRQLKHEQHVAEEAVPLDGPCGAS